MSKHLSHQDWVKEQFKPKYLKDAYRNATLHASIIEAILEAESGVDSFDTANKFLLCSKKITADEFCVFNKIRDTRNNLVHRIFSKKKKLSQDQINKLITDLMEKIRLAYKRSIFLETRLFRSYGITRDTSIKLKTT